MKTTMRNAVKKLNAAGLRALIREEASHVRRRRRLREADMQNTPDVEEAIEELTGVLLDQLFPDDIDSHDGAHPEVHNAIMACVDKILAEYGADDTH